MNWTHLEKRFFGMIDKLGMKWISFSSSSRISSSSSLIIIFPFPLSTPFILNLKVTLYPSESFYCQKTPHALLLGNHLPIYISIKFKLRTKEDEKGVPHKMFYVCFVSWILKAEEWKIRPTSSHYPNWLELKERLKIGFNPKSSDFSPTHPSIRPPVTWVKLSKMRKRSSWLPVNAPLYAFPPEIPTFHSGSLHIIGEGIKPSPPPPLNSLLMPLSRISSFFLSFFGTSWMPHLINTMELSLNYSWDHKTSCKVPLAYNNHFNPTIKKTLLLITHFHC